MKVKKIPLRMCTGCMEMKPKKELIRVVKSQEGEVSVDLTGKKAGRGAYICKSIECLEKAFKAKRLSRNLDVAINEEIYNRLRVMMGSHILRRRNIRLSARPSCHSIRLWWISSKRILPRGKGYPWMRWICQNSST